MSSVEVHRIQSRNGYGYEDDLVGMSSGGMMCLGIEVRRHLSLSGIIGDVVAGY